MSIVNFEGQITHNEKCNGHVLKRRHGYFKRVKNFSNWT
jgi:hypothetical protein